MAATLTRNKIWTDVIHNVRLVHDILNGILCSLEANIQSVHPFVRSSKLWWVSVYDNHNSPITLSERLPYRIYKNL